MDATIVRIQVQGLGIMGARSIFLATVFMLNAVWSFSVFGQLYEVEVPSPIKNRDQAIQSAFKALVVRLSANEDLLKQTFIKAETIQARNYVNRIENQRSSSIVYFNSEAVQAFMQKHQVPIWSLNRPTVVLWGAIKDAGGLRMLNSELDELLYTQLQTTAQKYGLNLVLPIQDLQDSVNVTAQDIWGQFPTSLWAPSRRYHADAIIVAKWDQTETIWHTQMKLLGQHEFVFNATSEQPWQIVETSMQNLSHKLMQTYGLTHSVTRTLKVRFRGVSNSQDYTALTNTLNQLDMVKDASLVAVAPDSATFELLSQAASPDAIKNHLLSHRNLVQLGGAEQGDILQYRWVPK